MSNALDYLINHINYHLMNVCQSNKNGDACAMFGRRQLHFLVASRISGLTNQQVNKIINLAIKDVATKTKISFMITNSAIYIAAL